MNSKASDVSEGLVERLRARRRAPAIRSSYTGNPLSISGVEYLVNPDGPEAADEIDRLKATLSPPLPSLEVERLYVLFSDDGQHIRKWSREPFEGSKPVDAALSALPLDGGL